MEEKALLDYLESESFIKASSNATRLIGKLKSAVQRKEFYETHQILRTVYYRFINSRDKVFALENLLFEGARYLLKLQENVSGQDIATLFVECTGKCLQYYRDEGGEEAKVHLTTYATNHHIHNKTKDIDACHKIGDLAIMLPNTEIGQQKFVADALRILSPKLLNRALLHDILSLKFYMNKDYVNSRYHGLYVADVQSIRRLALCLIDYQSESGNRNEIDLFIAQFIFQYLCIQSPLDSSKPLNSSIIRRTREDIKLFAEQLFRFYVINHPQLSQVSLPFSLPLLNFTYFIISIIDKKEAATFSALCDIYRLAWARDPSYQGYLTRIGSIYFGIAQRQQGGGLFNNILQSLLESADEDEEDVLD